MIHILAFRGKNVFYGEGKTISGAIEQFAGDYEAQSGVPFMKTTCDEILEHFLGTGYQVLIEYIP